MKMKLLYLKRAILCSLIFFMSCKSDTTTSPGIVVGNLLWAPANLVNKGSTYSFAAAQEQCGSTSESGDHFCWNTLNSQVTTSTNATNTWDTISDPCAKVSPRGKWHTPTIDELQSLINSGGVAGTKNCMSGCYFGTSRVPAVADADYYVFLPAAGDRDDGNIKMYGRDIVGYYWASTPSAIVKGGACSLIFNGASSRTDAIGLSGGYGFSVRCVSTLQ